MEEALELARAKDTKTRQAGVELLYRHLESARRPLTAADATALVDLLTALVADANFRVSQLALQTLAAAAVLAGDHLKLHFNALVPAAVDRLGDNKQPVRDAARQLLITLMEVSSPMIIAERAGMYAWRHRSWRVREEFLRTAGAAVGLFAATELPLQRALLPNVLELLNDPNNSVREAAASCIEEMYIHGGPQFHDELQRHNLPSFMMKDINARLEKSELKVRPINNAGTHLVPTEMKSLNHNQKRSSPKAKRGPRDTPFSGGETDATEKPVDPIKVYSEKELIREFEKIASTLVPEKDWSLRISAMQRVEGLVFGGATDYPSFHILLKQLVVPLSNQLSDRRSSIVKQACHLLNLLSKELLGDFEASAEMFIPVLFKLVVITVLVIAESADNCIKTMLRNCKVARVLPRIADCAKNDRNAVLRARCCEYALLTLEYWADAPEIQRSADLYEDLIKCCVADAMSEVRSTARSCYRMFAKTWPERTGRLFKSFDPVIQRVVNEEDGGVHKRYASPSMRERGMQLSHTSSHASTLSTPGYGTSAIVAMDKSMSIASGASLSTGSLLLSQSKALVKGSDRSLENMLHASKQKVSAIESLLRGINISDKKSFSIACSASLNLGVDPPSSRDPPFPPALPASNHLHLDNSMLTDSTESYGGRGITRNGASSLTDVGTQIPGSKSSSTLSYLNLSSETLPGLSLHSMGRRSHEGLLMETNTDMRSTRQLPNMQIGKHFMDTHYKDGGYKNTHGGYVPNFQRPLLRKQVTGRGSPSGRNSLEENQISVDQLSSSTNGPASLSDALTEGLSRSSDWVTRVTAFNYVRTLLQQGPKGTQDIIQSFEKIMKLFFQHLDDPHHKVAQAALLTLAEIIPACRKPFESYLERILPHVFPRLIDPKEVVRQPCSATLEIVGRTYSTDCLLPAFLRSLDEQRSPKAKLAVIEFANNSFNKHAVNSDGYVNSGFLKLWLAKLAPLVNDKSMKLKEASISGIISVYSHFDSAAVLNFIVSLSVDEQNLLRRALKQYTPRIEVDLMNFLQSKKERQRVKSLYDQPDIVGSSSEEGYIGMSKKDNLYARFSAGSVDSDGARKWSSMQESNRDTSIEQSASEEIQHHSNENFDTEVLGLSGTEFTDVSPNAGILRNLPEKADNIIQNSVAPPHPDINRLLSSEGCKAIGLTLDVGSIQDVELLNEKVNPGINHLDPVNDPSIPRLLHQICNSNDENSALKKQEALQKFVEASLVNDNSVWTKYFNQILTAVLEVMDDPDSSIRELAISLIVEMLSNQKYAMDDSVEIVIEKLLHATKDVVAKVANEAHQCLTIVLSQFDPFRCLSEVVPLLVSDDEKTLVTCINCLTKLVGRLSGEELTTQLPSFLPALFDAFGNQSPDVRKSVVFCLVDIYIMLGKSFLPYLEGLSSTQLRLVTIYANRISQARSGAPIDGGHE